MSSKPDRTSGKIFLIYWIKFVVTDFKHSPEQLHVYITFYIQWRYVLCKRLALY